MKTLLSRVGVVALLLAAICSLAPRASAQMTRLSGKVLDLQGNPYPGVVITITNKDNGTKYTITTDKDGKFVQNGLPTGTYDVNFKKDNIDYTNTVKIDGSMSATGAVMDMNFKDIAAKSGYNAEAAKKAEEAKQKFAAMKGHFDNGVKAMNDASTTKQQLGTAPADQKATLQATLNTDYQTAVTEFEQAKQGAPENDKNLPIILGNLGAAYEGVGKYDQAVDATQQAIAIKPSAGLYMQLGTDLAHAGKIPDATAACDKAATIDPTNKSVGVSCYRNIGIVLTNAGKMNDAVAPLQKATQLDPSDADAWYMLGNALVAGIDTKTEGGKQVYVVPPGTEEAYKKYLELQPSGPHAAEAKESLATVQQMNGEKATTTVKNKKPGML
ncbi:MAG TPA: carboxypeptidase regulatory-like domain-containing protein [Candidatus Acidoferrales bacterium]|nr:carboxypeptidase regulatory-like domain-containing protein [Candidatus Acidoferrales bacterium]